MLGRPEDPARDPSSAEGFLGSVDGRMGTSLNRAGGADGRWPRCLQSVRPRETKSAPKVVAAVGRGWNEGPRSEAICLGFQCPFNRIG